MSNAWSRIWIPLWTNPRTDAVALTMASQSTTVGVVELAIGRAGRGRLAAFALRSCIGLSAWDPLARIGGLLHFLLPQPAGNGVRGATAAALQATTGIPRLVHELVAAGADAERLVLCAAGGADLVGRTAAVALGRRNCAMLSHGVRQLGLSLAAVDTGGRAARTMSLDLQCGAVELRSRRGTKVLWQPDQPPLHREPPAT